MKMMPFGYLISGYDLFYTKVKAEDTGGFFSVFIGSMGSSDEKRSDEKREQFEEWMQGEHVLLHVDASNEDVDVPLQYQGNPALALKLSYYFQGEVTHDESEVVSYLKFDGNYSRCVLPWNSVWGITASSGENRVWPEDVPREVYLQMARAKLSTMSKKLFGKFGGPDGEEDGEEAEEEAGEKEEQQQKSSSKTKSKSSHLKRVK